MSKWRPLEKWGAAFLLCTFAISLIHRSVFFKD